MNDKNIAEIIERYKEIHGNSLIGVLQAIQEEYRYIPEGAIKIVAEKLGLPLIDVYGVATFYTSFNLKPVGEHLVTVCLGTACHVRGGARIVDAISRYLKIRPGETTCDLKFTLQTVSCLGCCAIGPIVLVDGKYHGQMIPSKVVSILENIREKKDAEVEIVKRT